MLRTAFGCIVLLAVFASRADALTMGVYTGYEPCISSGSCTHENPHYLSGSFFLDESTPFDVVVNSLGSGGFLTSPLQTIQGQFGEYTFEGSAAPLQFGGRTFESSLVLHVFDFLEVLDLQTDFWILRAALTGPTVNGVSPTLLNMFIWAAPPDDSTNTVSIYPPLLGFNRSYVIGFSDGSFASGPLSTVQVPDVGLTWSLMLIAGIALLALRWSSYSPNHQRPD